MCGGSDYIQLTKKGNPDQGS